jgi:Glycosyltransferase
MSDKKEAIIILTPGFPENEDDTNCLPERQIFVKALKKANPHLNIIILSFQYPFSKKHYLWHGMDVFSFNGRNRPRLSRVMIWVRVWKRMRTINRKYKIKGVLSFWLGECAFVGNIFTKRCHLQHYICLLGQDARPGNKYVPLIKPNPNFLIAISDFLADEFFKNYLIMPRHVVPTGIDATLFADNIADRTIDILGAGSLIPLKRFDLFIEIIHELVADFPNIKILICGNGPEKESLQLQINAFKLGKNIRLVSELPHKELLRMMQQSRIFLHTSSYEGFATVITEALYAGAHVVCFCKPMKEPINQLYVVENKKQMIDKVRELLQQSTAQESVFPYSPEMAARYISGLLVEEKITNFV